MTASCRADGFFLPTGIDALDRALGGGLPKAALTEIHGAETRDAGAVAGFALALASLILKGQKAGLPLLWIGTSEIFREAGFPYAAGLARDFGIAPEALLFSEAPKLADALWIAEEAARLSALAAVVIELRGNPDRLDLTATRRLHRRAEQAGRPVLLIRQAAASRADGRPCPPRRGGSAGRTTRHACGSACRIDRRARLHADDRQEPHRAAWAVHCGVE